MQYVVENLEIDEDGFELRRNGSVVVVEPLVLDFILYLIRNQARLVTKDELLDTVWQSCCVVESAIARCVCLARKALGDPSLIRTVYGRGYRWSAPSTRVVGGTSSERDDNETIKAP